MSSANLSQAKLSQFELIEAKLNQAKLMINLPRWSTQHSFDPTDTVTSHNVRIEVKKHISSAK